MVYTPRNILLPAAVALVAVQMQQAAATSLYYDPYTSANTTDEISSKFPARGGQVSDQDCAITVEVDPTLPNITTISTVAVTYTDLLANMTTAPTDAVSTKVGTAIVTESTPSSDEDQDAYTNQGSGSTTQDSGASAPTSKTGTTVSQTSTAGSSSTTKSGKTGVTTAPVSTTATPVTSTAGSAGSATTSTEAPSTTTSGKTGVTTSAPVSTTATPVTSTAGSATTSTEAPSTTTSGKTGVTTTTTAPSTGSAVEGTSDSEEPNCATGWETTTRKLREGAMSGRELKEKNEKKRQLEENSNKDIAKLEAYFGTSMVTKLSELPTVAVHTPSPWPGPYWPTYQDSINVVWSAGEPSAAEKYATAFGLDVDDFMDKVSADNGIDSMSSHTACTSDSDCSSLTDGSECAIRAGKSSGYCIPTWYGICHAWTPASMLEDEPQCAVTYNGVTFQPMDLKALLSDVYDGATVSTVFTGTRYNGGTDSEDEYGRHSNDAYRDLNPAYFHIAAANLLGNLNATFIADVTAGSEVWNQPVRGFKVYEQTAMSLEDAASTFYGLEEYPWNSAAKSIVYVKTRLSWIFETYTDGPLVSSGKVDSYTTGDYYYYLLEMDDDDNIIGGEWVYDSDSDHPDFLWFPKAKPAADTVTSIGLSYADVTMLLEKSVACEGSSSGSTSAGDSASASASTSSSFESSTSASFEASTSASASFPSSETSSDSGSEGAATIVPGFSASTSNTGSFTESTDAPTQTPEATYDSTVTTAPASTTTTAPATTTAAPATTTATPSSNHQNDDSDDNQQQQQQQQQSHWWFNWW